MFENLNYIPTFTDTYSSELSQIEAAAERASATVAAERARLLRPDGTARYTPAEHAEREAAIYQTAGAQFDQATARYLQQSEREVTDLQKQITRLDGFDPFDSLKPDEQQKAGLRREFVKEDFDALDAPDAARQAQARIEIERRARAAIAAGDRATAYLYFRYAQGRRDVADVATELAAMFLPPDRSERRRDLETKLRAAQALPIAVSSARRRVDGSDERLLAGMRAGRL